MGGLAAVQVLIGGFCCLVVLAAIGGIVYLVVRSSRK
jgi:hypothetical protein